MINHEAEKSNLQCVFIPPPQLLIDLKSVFIKPWDLSQTFTALVFFASILIFELLEMNLKSGCVTMKMPQYYKSI
jgi:hypothetical protein